MNLGISQLAFNSETDFDSMIQILKENNILNIEIIFPKIISWNKLDLTILRKYSDKLNELGFNHLSTQSITYGTSLKSFCDENFIKHIFQVSDLCKITNTKIMVLGAPGLRNSFNKDILLNNFKKIDSYLKENNQILCIEPNSSWYGGEFFLYLDEIISFIKCGDFTNIKTMIDTHNLIKENKNPTEEFIKYQKYISHIHISENDLGFFITSHEHKCLGECLRDKKYDGIIIYETKYNDINNKEFINSLINFKTLYN